MCGGRSKRQLRKVFCDFNEGDKFDRFFVLFVDGVPLRDCEPSNGEHVVLYQDDDDFKVLGILSFEPIEVLGRTEWIATPDWDTLVRTPGEEPLSPSTADPLALS